MIFKPNSFLLQSHPNPPQNGGSREGKSRRDGTLLTVYFNIRKKVDVRAPQSPAGTTQAPLNPPKRGKSKCRPCGTWGATVDIPVRRLKPTVNKVLSLRDSSPLTTLV